VDLRNDAYVPVGVFYHSGIRPLEGITGDDVFLVGDGLEHQREIRTGGFPVLVEIPQGGEFLPCGGRRENDLEDDGTGVTKFVQESGVYLPEGKTCG